MTWRRLLLILAIALVLLGFALGAYGYLRPGALPDWLWKLLVVLSGLGALAAGVEAALRIFTDKTLLDLWRETAPGPRPGAPYQAPRPLPEFVGRHDELRRLERALKPGSKVAITGVVGMAGIGKTELAKLAAHRVAHRFRDGVLWADCGQEQLKDVADRWAGAIAGVERLPGDDLTSKAPAWRGLISGREALLIFDNVQPDQDIAPLCPPRGRSTVLITTRHKHHPALDGAQRVELDRFTWDEARALARQVLGAAAREQQAELRRLCELLGYLPLAVSIALHTARECDWRLAELNRRLEERGALRGLDEASTRRSLQATFETAWANLPPDLQCAFQVLAVFNAGPSFHTGAMAAVLEREKPEARALLHRLAGRSLLTRVGEARWSLHPLLREFAAVKLPADDPAWARMAVHYAQVARAADALYLQGGEGVLRGLTLFDQEWPHIQAGQAWAVREALALPPPRPSPDTGEGVGGEGPLPLQLCSAYPDATAHCLSLRLHPREWIAWLEAAVEAARRLGDREAEGTHLGNLGNAYRQLGDARRAIEYYEQALAIHREIGDRRGEGADLNNLGLAYADLGDARRAIEYYEQALEISREIGDRRGEGNRLGSLGNAYLHLGDARRAIEYYEQALAIAREIGDRRGEGADLNNLRLAFQELGQHAAALACFRLAVAVGQAIEDPRVEGRLENIEELKELVRAERFAALEREVAGREEAVLAQALRRGGRP